MEGKERKWKVRYFEKGAVQAVICSAKKNLRNSHKIFKKWN